MRYLIAVIALVAILPLQLHAQQTWHVYPGQSIQAAIDNAGPGDNVVVHSEIFRGYTYYESITLSAGVSVYSVDYEPEVTIDGQGATQTVYFYGNGQGMYFGGPDVGFTIKGGDTYGVFFNGCEDVHVEDLVVESDPGLWAMLVNTWGDETTVHFKNITIQGQTETIFGLYLASTDVTIENLTVLDFANTAVCAEGHHPTLHGFQIENCDIGVKARDSTIDIIGADAPWNRIEDCSSGASAVSIYWSGRINAENVKFLDCDFGLGAGGTEIRSASVYADNCEFLNCDVGVSANWAYGSVKNCYFHGAMDTGISITNYHFTPFIIGGDDPWKPEENTFMNIPGTGIHLGSGAQAHIGYNDFHRVSGTSILVETGNSDVTVHDCTMWGTNDCFQGIRTRGQNTLATIRKCEIRDYDDVMLPLPRGVNVSSPSANLGTMVYGDWGNNKFYDNTYDVYYSDGQFPLPVPILAQYNYWGENPPDPQDFGGKWADYIIWEPYLTEPPPLAPPLVDGPSVPDRLVLEPIRPNPVRETASLVYGLPSCGPAELSVWDTQGRLVTTLLDGKHSAGTGIVEWDTTDGSGSSVPSGVYFCRLSSFEGTITRRLVLVR
jgi:hypothetical protein